MDMELQPTNSKRSLLAAEGSCLNLKEDLALVTGGVNRNTVCLLQYIDEPSKVIPNATNRIFKVIQLPNNLINRRHAHCSIHLLDSIFVLGGR